MFAREAFVRADYEYQERAKWLAPSQDPNTQQHDAANFLLDATNFLSLRGGLAVRPWTVSAFVDNLTNTHVLTNYNWSINYGGGASRLPRNFTFRPRTFGVTAVYRF